MNIRPSVAISVPSSRTRGPFDCDQKAPASQNLLVNRVRVALITAPLSRAFIARQRRRRGPFVTTTNASNCNHHGLGGSSSPRALSKSNRLRQTRRSVSTGITHFMSRLLDTAEHRHRHALSRNMRPKDTAKPIADGAISGALALEKRWRTRAARAEEAALSHRKRTTCCLSAPVRSTQNRAHARPEVEVQRSNSLYQPA